MIAEMSSAAVMLAIVVPRLRADGLAPARGRAAVMWDVVKVGAHLVQRTAFLLAALAVATAAASRVGTDELAAHQIVAQLFLFLAIGVDMFKVAGQSLVGHALGAARPDEARDVVRHLYGWAWRAACCSRSSSAPAPLLPHAVQRDARRARRATVASCSSPRCSSPARSRSCSTAC